MKDLSIEEFEAMLCSTGYLSPRDEEELLFFEQMFDGYTGGLAEKHVDVESIISGTCRLVPLFACRQDEQDLSVFTETEIVDNRYSMAARNFRKLPKDVLDKMRNQHKSIKGDE